MKLTMRAAAKKVTLITTAFVLAVSILTAAVPFVLSKNAGAVSAITVTPDSNQGWAGIDHNGQGGSLSFVNDPNFSMSWNAVAGATVYEYRTSNSLVDATTLGPIAYTDSSASASNYTLGAQTITRGNNGTPEGNWYWQVRAGNGSGVWSAWSAINLVTTDYTGPAIVFTHVVVTQDPNAAPGSDDGDDTNTNLPSAVGPAGNVAAVLGLDSTNTGDDTTQGTEGVEGTSTEKNLAAAVDTDSTDGTVLGMAWYWWLLILAALATLIWWIIASIRNRAAKN